MLLKKRTKIKMQKQKNTQTNKSTRPYLIGITGSLGTGKSLVGSILKKLGVYVIDTDEIVRNVLSYKNEITKKIVGEFGTNALSSNGSINRKYLSSIVFSNKIKLKKLESIIHPEVQKKLTLFFKLNKNKKIIAVLIPLLFECNMQKFYDESWCVVCNKKIQLKRLKARRYLLKDALARINAQFPQSRKAKMADFIINNSGSSLTTKKQVVKRIRSLDQLIHSYHLFSCK